GMAIKLMKVEGTRLLDRDEPLTQDFLMVNQPMFAFSNVEDYAAFNEFSLKSADIGAFIKSRIKPDAAGKPDMTDPATRRILRSAGIVKRIASPSVNADPPAFQPPPASPADNRYFSAAPYLFGPNAAMKYSARPVAPSAAVPNVADPSYLRAALLKSLTGPEAKDIVFDFQVQVRTKAELAGKIEEEIEDASFEWDETKFPYVTVARITIPPQNFDTDARRRTCEDLFFTPWHSVAEFQPIGGINRLKLRVYEASSAFRHFPKEPTGWAVPPGGPIEPLGGLNPADRKTLYHLPEGSELFPIDWLRAMTSLKTGKPFLDDLGRFGLIADPDGPEFVPGKDARRLPVGLTRTKPIGSGIEMLGVNCAACHVAEVRYKGAVVRVDGAPGLFDIQGFYAEMFQSAAATVSKRERLVAFLTTLEKNGPRDPATKLLAGLLPFLTGQATADAAFEALLMKRLSAALGGAGGAEESALAAVLTAPTLFERVIALQRLAEARLAQLKEERQFLQRLTELAASLKTGGTSVPLLLARLSFLKRLRALDAHGATAPRPGFGRVDAFTSARNFLFDPSEARAPSAPVRYPFLWGLDKRWLHWDGNTMSVMERNVGQALGLGGVTDAKTLSSTLLPGNLHELEQVAKKLKPPAWPAAFGAVNRNSDEYKIGAKLYAANCAACHEKQDVVEPYGKKVTDGGVVYLVGTDEARTKVFADKLADGRDFAESVGLVQRKIKKKAYDDHRAELEKKYGAGFETPLFDEPDAKIRWLTTGGYVARPLAGAWATAPYLHNGSVPTMADLLEPVHRRPVVFPVGHREYDPVRVGFVSRFDDVPEDQVKSYFVFDTRAAGNRNTGHEFGTNLTDGEKRALLLYLKGME
ncbi:MAG TPA: di-heme-cytochrome C peroxidase, partial [Gemmataceae bacterium]|nr:di-heme-cytochrome C peroxidase [Gemmataceae bacterium]